MGWGRGLTHAAVSGTREEGLSPSLQTPSPFSSSVFASRRPLITSVPSPLKSRNVFLYCKISPSIDPFRLKKNHHTAGRCHL